MIALSLSLASVACTPAPSTGSVNSTNANTMTAEQAQAVLKKMMEDLPKKDNAPAPPIPNTDEYGDDLAGQVQRIVAEGTGDEQVRKNMADADKSVTYEHLKKNAERYAGRPWIFTGRILEISESQGGTMARMSLDDWGNKVIYVAAPLQTDFVEKNRVLVVGYLAGNYSYTSQANWNITIPAVAARAIMKPSGKK
jgi:hypothetical protein